MRIRLVYASLLLLASLPGCVTAVAEKNEAWPADAPYNQYFDPYHACMTAEPLAMRGAPDALRTMFLSAYVRLCQPFLGGEDVQMHGAFERVYAAIGDKSFARALEKQRPDVRSAVAYHLSGTKCGRETGKLLRASPLIDWPMDQAYRNDR